MAEARAVRPMRVITVSLPDSVPGDVRDVVCTWTPTAMPDTNYTVLVSVPATHYGVWTSQTLIDTLAPDGATVRFYINRTCAAVNVKVTAYGGPPA